MTHLRVFTVCVLKHVKVRRKWWAWHVSRVVEMRGAYWVWMGKPEVKGPFGRPSSRIILK